LDIVYKMFKVKKNGNLVSLFTEGMALVKYNVGKWSEPRRWLLKQGYGLTAFKSLEELRGYSVFFPENYVIAECEAEVNMPLQPRSFMTPLSLGEIDPICVDWPCGTVMYKRIKPLRILWSSAVARREDL
jgi:hypothetical protein